MPAKDDAVVSLSPDPLPLTPLPGTLLNLFEIESVDTAFFLLSREELPIIVPTLESISLSPPGASISARSTLQFTATATYSDGSALDITALVLWTSSNLAVTTVAPGGLAIGVLAGTATITATLGTVEGSASLTVTLF